MEADEGSQGGEGGPLLFKKKKRGVGGGPIGADLRPSGLGLTKTGGAEGGQDDREKQDDTVTIRRTTKADATGRSRARGVTAVEGRNKASGSSLSFKDATEGATDEQVSCKLRARQSMYASQLTCALFANVQEASSAFVLRRSKLALAARQPLPTPVDEDRSAEGTSYTISDLSALRAASSSRVPPGVDANGLSDFSNQGLSIPTEEAIREAKQKRGEAAKGSRESKPADFISLSGDRGSGRGESRLQREEDELGSGEDEFGGFTVDEEALALNNGERKRAAEERRRKMQAAFEGVHLGDDGPDSDDDERMEELAWEKAQLSRWQTSSRAPDDHLQVSLALISADTRLCRWLTLKL